MEPKSGMPRTKARVPSIGSIVQRQRVPVPVKPSSSPRMSIGPAGAAPARCARITDSASRSARVTGDPSAFRSRPIRPLPKYPRMTGAAASAASIATCSSVFSCPSVIATAG